MFNTPQGGFLWVKHNETMNLAWGVSMFHAIHCLTLLREQVQMDQNLKNATMGHNPHNDHQLPGHSAFDSTHVGHCFSYIAQVSLSIHTSRRVIEANQKVLLQSSSPITNLFDVFKCR